MLLERRLGATTNALFGDLHRLIEQQIVALDRLDDIAIAASAGRANDVRARLFFVASKPPQRREGLLHHGLLALRIGDLTADTQEVRRLPGLAGVDRDDG